MTMTSEEFRKKVEIPPPDGFPITQILLADSGHFLNVSETDVGHVWERLCQLRDDDDPNATALFYEPQYQGPLFVTKAALPYVIAVTRAYASEKRTELGRENIALPAKRRIIH
jgi:hypothetical protein